MLVDCTKERPDCAENQAISFLFTAYSQPHEDPPFVALIDSLAFILPAMVYIFVSDRYNTTTPDWQDRELNRSANHPVFLVHVVATAAPNSL